MNRPLLIIKTGATFDDTRAERGDFEDWIRNAITTPSNVMVVDVTAMQPLPPTASICGAVITGSHAMVSEQPPWLAPLQQWLCEAHHREVPLLGICFGHQLLAATLGGNADYHPAGPEIGCHTVTLNTEGQADPLLGALPTEFPAHLTHHQSALTLPPAAVVLASSPHEPHQAFRLGNMTWGVQFHPEFKKATMAIYVQKQRSALQAHGQDPEAILQAITTSPAETIIPRFYQLAKAHAPRID